MTKQAVEDNVDALARAILSEAQAEAEHIKADAREKAETVKKNAQAQAEELRRGILQRVNEEAQRLHGQSIATAQMKARKMQLEHREKLLDQVFTEAQKELAHVQHWSDYAGIAQNLLREAVLHLRAKEVKIRADQKTMALLESGGLELVAKELDVTINKGEPLAQGTGILVETMDGHRQYDNTLETRLSRMQNGLRSPVYHLLMGEKL
jgi:vacuolar-type H+-ATPase subunit E/Vma4